MKTYHSNYRIYDTFYIGFVVHKKSWKISIRFDGREMRHFSMAPPAEQLRRLVDKQYEPGRFMTVYEAGFRIQAGLNQNFQQLENEQKNTNMGKSLYLNQLKIQ